MRASLRRELLCKDLKEVRSIHIREYYRKREMGKQMLQRRSVAGVCQEQPGGQCGWSSAQESESPRRGARRGEQVGQRDRQVLQASGNKRMVIFTMPEIRSQWKILNCKVMSSDFGLPGS